MTREHEDLEIGVFRHDQHALRGRFAEWGQFKSISGWVPWEEGELLELPIHQVLFRPPGSGPPPDPWEPAPEERQFFLNEVEDGVWICRRDRAVTCRVGNLTLRSTSGIPIVAPEIQLLYKAKHKGEKDEHDFRETEPLLDSTRREWLKRALEIVHPGDPWLDALG